MFTKSLYTSFELEYLETRESLLEAHAHTFFELVYVLEGTGVQSVNRNRLAYEPDKMFLLMPQDSHSFEISSPTRFLFIRFNNIYLQMQDKAWLEKLEYIFHHHNHLPGCILKNASDKILVKPLIEALLREHMDQQMYHRELAQQLINALITITARNISLMLKDVTQHQDRTGSQAAQELLQYIHLHIYQPEALKADKIAAQFHVAPSYISEYFKKLTGESLQNYIIQYKVRLVETRLLFSDLRMNEIAYELGFTDESHLNRIFKKYRGVSPSTFKKQALV